MEKSVIILLQKRKIWPKHLFLGLVLIVKMSCLSVAAQNLFGDDSNKLVSFVSEIRPGCYRFVDFYKDSTFLYQEYNKSGRLCINGNWKRGMYEDIDMYGKVHIVCRKLNTPVQYFTGSNIHSDSNLTAPNQSFILFSATGYFIGPGGSAFGSLAFDVIPDIPPFKRLARVDPAWIEGDDIPSGPHRAYLEKKYNISVRHLSGLSKIWNKHRIGKYKMRAIKLDCQRAYAVYSTENAQEVQNTSNFCNCFTNLHLKGKE